MTKTARKPAKHTCSENGSSPARLNSKCMALDCSATDAHLRAIFNAEPECVKLVARDGSLLDMNPAGLAMIGAESIDQVAGQSVFDLIAPEYREAYEQMHDRVCSGEQQTLEFEIIGMGGNR